MSGQLSGVSNPNQPDIVAMIDTVTAYLLLGSNVGDRLRYLHEGLTHLGRHMQVVRCSAVYETEPWGNRDQPPFYNMAVSVQTHLSPNALLHCVKSIEQQVGRSQHASYQPRELDIDILLYGQQHICQPQLQIPHPLLQHRRFALAPLNEIASQFMHPLLRQSVGQLLTHCIDSRSVRPLGPLAWLGQTAIPSGCAQQES